jgi:hypothetical protein
MQAIWDIVVYLMLARKREDFTTSMTGLQQVDQHLLFTQIIKLGDIPFHKHDRIAAS